MKLNDFKNSWALVTGASSGIGEEFCRQLAGFGMNVVMTARRESQLQKTAKELRTQQGIQILTIPIDLTEEQSAKKIKSRLQEKGIRIRLLINNAAVGHWGRFEDASEDKYNQMIQVNIGSVIETTQTFLSDLTSFESSAIINVSSPAAIQPVPYMAVYAATKAFVSGFSLALYEEWREKGVLVHTFIPGPTATALEGSDALGIPLASPSDSVARFFRKAESNNPIACSTRGLFKQKLFTALISTKFLLRFAARLFHPKRKYK